MDDPEPAAAAPARFYTAETLARGPSVGLLMKRAVQSLLQGMDRDLAPHGLTHAQWLPLYRIGRGECTTPAALARELDMDPGAMTRVVDRLEAKGLLARERSLDDRRVVQLRLTTAGQAAAELVPPVAAAVLNAHLAGFSTEEWKQLEALLQRVLANGEALRAAAGKPGGA